MQSTHTYRMVLLTLLSALAMVFHYVESLIPVPYLMPGAKLGLANVVSLYVVMTMNTSSALVLSVLRTTVGSLIGGTFMTTTFILSFVGAMLSTLVMGLTASALGARVSPIGVSIVGAIAHNIGQLLAAAYIVRQPGVFFYLPYLLFFALPTGLFIGILVKKLPKTMRASY